MPSTIHNTPCRYCGQVINVNGADDPEETAALTCNCAQARSYQVKVAEVQRRQDNIDEVCDAITEMLLGGAEREDLPERELERVTQAEAVLHNAVGPIYDRLISKVALAIHNTRITVARNSKGNVTAERVTTSAEKMEFKS